MNAIEKRITNAEVDRINWPLYLQLRKKLYPRANQKPNTPFLKSVIQDVLFLLCQRVFLSALKIIFIWSNANAFTAFLLRSKMSKKNTSRRFEKNGIKEIFLVSYTC